MKTKKTKSNKKSKAQKEIDKAYAILKKHNVHFVSIEPDDFLQFPIYDCWADYGIVPSKKNIERVMAIATDYINAEYFELMEDSISRLSTKMSFGNIK
jgi:hypothetical protein